LKFRSGKRETADASASHRSDIARDIAWHFSSASIKALSSQPVTLTYFTIT